MVIAKVATSTVCMWRLETNSAVTRTHTHTHVVQAIFGVYGISVGLFWSIIVPGVMNILTFVVDQHLAPFAKNAL